MKVNTSKITITFSKKELQDIKLLMDIGLEIIELTPSTKDSPNFFKTSDQFGEICSYLDIDKSIIYDHANEFIGLYNKEHKLS